jgi:hypothetical protein
MFFNFKQFFKLKNFNVSKVKLTFETILKIEFYFQNNNYFKK